MCPPQPRHHRVEPQAAGVLGRDRRADDAAGVPDDEGHPVRGAQRGRDDEVSLALPALAERCDEIQQREVAFYGVAQRAGVLRDDVPAVWIGHLVFGAMVAARDALRFGTVARRDLEALVETTVLNGVAR